MAQQPMLFNGGGGGASLRRAVGEPSRRTGSSTPARDAQASLVVPVAEGLAEPIDTEPIDVDPVSDDLPEAWLLTEREAASVLSISPRKLWELRNRGEVPHVRFGRSVRYDPDDLKAWLKDQKTTR